MQAIDVTGLSQKEIDDLEKNPSRMELDDNNIAHPLKRNGTKVKPLTIGDRTIVVNVKDTDKNRKLKEKFGEKIFNSQGKIDYRKFPSDEILKRMVRRKGDSRENLMEQLGVPFCKKLLDKIPKSDLKLQTKKELKRAIRKYAGMPAEKSAKQKRKEKETKATKKSKKIDIEGPCNKGEENMCK